MKRLLMTIMMLVVVGLSAFADSEPIITIKTNRYAVYGKENNFVFSMTALQKLGSTTVEVDFGYGKKTFVVSSDGQMTEDEEDEVITGGSQIAGSVGPEGIVRVYGDPKAIDYLDCHGSNVYEIDLSRMTELAILEVGHNELHSLNTAGMPYLEYLDAKDNPFDQGLTLGNHPYLKYLNLNQMGEHALDKTAGTVDLTGYKALGVFTAWDSHCLKSVDVSKCTILKQLSIDNTNVTSLDLTNNEYLQILNISDCGINSIDLSHCPYLVEFYATNEGQETDDRKLSVLDITNNTYLQRLAVSGNNLKTIDVTKQWNLVSLSANHNQLTHIAGVDLDEREALKADGKPSGPYELAELSVRFNNFTFANLPKVDPMTEFDYSLQYEMPVGKEYGVCEAGKLDLSGYIKREGTSTGVALAWISRDGFSEDGQLIEGKDYNYDAEAGIITFLKEQKDSVQVACYNDVFDGVVLLTTKFLVRSAENYGKAVELMSFTPGSFASYPLALATREDENLYIDCGDGIRKEYALKAGELTTLNLNVTGRVRIYGRVATAITELQLKNIPLVDIDVNKQTDMKSITIDNCDLASIDLSWNHLLDKIAITNNKLTALDLNGANSAFHKNLLHEVNVSNNLLVNLDLGIAAVTIKKVNASGNKLSELTLSEMERLTDLNLSNNNFEYLDLKDCSALKALNLSHNSLTGVDITACKALEQADLSYNLMSFSSLPADTEGMILAPQAQIKIASRATTVNLSAQAKIGSTPTIYTWYETETGNALVEGTDYTITNGLTEFTTASEGKAVYCVLLNEQQPQFVGENALRTTQTIITGKPKYEIASFKTPVGGQKPLLSLGSTKPDTYIYIDWGDDELTEYALQESYTRYEGKASVAGANVKVYSNDAANGNLGIFSVDSLSMQDVDVSRLSDLYCLTLNNAKLKTIDLSNLAKLRELDLQYNMLESIDLSHNPELSSLILSNNKLSTLDLSNSPNVFWFGAAYNNFSEFDASQLPRAYNVDLAGNHLKEFNAKAMPELGQLFIAQNELTHLDIEGLRLFVLDISGNYFDFSSLPYPNINVFFYGNQAELPIECVDGRIDLTSQVKAWDTPSSIYFFDDKVEIYEDASGNLTFDAGEFVEGTDFINEDGLIGFYQDQPQVVGAIMNELYPNLILYTKMISVTAMPDPDAIECVEADADVLDKAVYNLAGQRVNANTKGLVIKNGKAMIVK